MEVTNKEAIAVFEDMKRGVFPFDARPYCDAAIHALHVLDGKFDWTPVSERLPEKGNYYLVSLDTVGFPQVSIDEFVITSTQKWKYCGDLVTAWMPLPKLYKEEK